MKLVQFCLYTLNFKRQLNQEDFEILFQVFEVVNVFYLLSLQRLLNYSFNTCSIIER